MVALARLGQLSLPQNPYTNRKPNDNQLKFSSVRALERPFSWKTVGDERIVVNDIGPVAITYAQVMNTRGIDAAKSAFETERASYPSVVKVVYQGAEAALINMASLLERAARKLKSDPNAALEYLQVAQSFNRTMVSLSNVPFHSGGYTPTLDPLNGEEPNKSRSQIKISDSDNYQRFLKAKKEFDQELQSFYKGKLAESIEDDGLATVPGRLQHLTTQFDHSLQTWDNSLQSMQIPIAVNSYEQFIRPELVASVIEHPHYGPETLFNEFRSSHIIPELIAREINDHFHKATTHLKAYNALKGIDTPQRAQQLETALQHTRFINALFPVISESFENLADSLPYSEYKKFRANLGVISGNESAHMGLMLKKVQTDFGSEVKEALKPSIDSEPALEQSLLRSLHFEAIEVYDGLKSWYSSHLVLPFLEVGSSQSLKGAPDAVQSLIRIEQALRKKQPYADLSEDHLLAGSADSPVLAYLFSGESFFHQRLVTLGGLNKKRFEYLSDTGNPFVAALTSANKVGIQEETIKKQALKDHLAEQQRNYLERVRR